MEAPRTNLRKTEWGVWLPLVLPAAAAVAAWLLYRSPPPAEDPAPAAAAPAPAAPAPVEPAAEPPAQAAEAGALLEKVSSNELLRKAIAAGDVVHRWVLVTANLAAGESPRRALPFLAPRGAFSVERRGGRLAISAAACARYDAFADAIASLDAAAAVSVYRRLHGVLEALHRTLGLSAGSLDELTFRALRRVAEAPAPADPAAVEPAQEGQYVFADRRLEALTDVEKHLLRMGPRNQRLIQAKAWELLARLASGPVAVQAPPAGAPAAPIPTSR